MKIDSFDLYHETFAYIDLERFSSILLEFLLVWFKPRSLHIELKGAMSCYFTILLKS